MMLRQMLTATLMALAALSAHADTMPPPLAAAPVRSGGGQALYAAEGVVEAVRQSVISAQVPGAITQLTVKAGDAVRAGQVLVRIDARAASQTAAASSAQVEAARAELNVATKDYGRQQQLFAQKFISQAALDRAEAQFKAARAQANALLAQAGAALTQSGFYTLAAPYDGWVAEVPAMQGDMVMPGRSLLTVYDPILQRVSASVPQTAVAGLIAGQPVKIELPGLPPGQRWQTAARMTVLPMADAATHTVQVHLDLPPRLPGLTPGMFARALLPVAGDGERRLYVPGKAVFRRAEFAPVYVLNDQGRPLLRQIRPGPALGDEIEVLSGVSVGERVVLDPLAAARVR